MKSSGTIFKVLSKSLCFLGVLGCVFIGFLLLYRNMLLGMLVLILGSTFCFISAVIICELGELIEKANEIARNTALNAIKNSTIAQNTKN